MARAELKPVFDFCKENGFEINSNDPFQLTFTITKKDEWEGVEFVKLDGKIEKIEKIESILIYTKEAATGKGYKHITPSTEQAYVDQLKAEAFKRYGEIKVGDKFVDWDGTDFKISGIGGYQYSKHHDALYFHGWEIYNLGKWSTKIEPKVKIKVKKPYVETYGTGEIFLSFRTTADWNDHDLKGIKKKLRAKLKKLLNK